MTHTDYKFKTYRCEWQVQLGTVDQYGQNFESYKEYSFPTREEAIKFLPEVAHQHQYIKERWIPNDAPHGYCEAVISFKERFMS